MCLGVIVRYDTAKVFVFSIPAKFSPNIFIKKYHLIIVAQMSPLYGRKSVCRKTIPIVVKIIGDDIAVDPFWVLCLLWRWRRHRSVTGVCALAYPRLVIPMNALWRSAPTPCNSDCSGTPSGCSSHVFSSSGTRFARTRGYWAETPSASIARLDQPKVTQITVIS